MDLNTKELVKNVCIFCCNTYRKQLSTTERLRLLKLTKSGWQGKKNFHKLKRQLAQTVPLPPKEKKGSKSKSSLVQTRRFLVCTDPNFREFCKLIETLPNNKNDGVDAEGGDDEFSTDALMQSMAFFKALAVCEQCLRRLRRCNEASERIIQREEEILRLQKKLLKELKGLEQDLGPYQEDLEFIEEGIRKSDVDYLEQFLDAMIESERTTSENEGSGLLHKAVVTTYRKLALDASVELKCFRSRLESRDDPLFKSVPQKRPREPPADEDDELSPKHFHKKAKKIKIVVPGGQVSQDPCSSSVALHPVAGNDDDDDDEDDNPVIKAEIESDEVHQSEDEAELPFYDGNLSEGLLQDQDEDTAYSDSSSASDDEYFEKPRPKRRRKRARSHNRYHLRPTSDVEDYSSAWSGNDSNDSDSDESVDFGSDLDEDPRDTDFVPEEKLKRTKLEVVIPPAAKFEEQSEFTKLILGKVYRRIALRNSGQYNDPISKDDPRYEYVVDYDPERRRLFVGGIDIIINDEQRRLECSQCDYTNGKLEHGQLLSKLRHHIMGKHLELYKCSQCPKRFALISSFKAHMRFHESAIVCDVCGRPLSSRSLYHHKWSHMNADEVAEALAKGLKDPRLSRRQLTEEVGEQTPCTTCGKCFRRRGELRQHEKFCRSDRTKFPCSQCGKLLFEESLQSHMKYSCPNRNQDDDEVNTRLECFRCPGKKFKNIIMFRRHMKHGHKPVEKRFVCETCGTAYVNNYQLKLHVRTKHLGERPFACGLGCGATFTRKENAERHQSTCPLGKARTETTESSRKTEEEGAHEEPEQECYYANVMY